MGFGEGLRRVKADLAPCNTLPPIWSYQLECLNKQDGGGGEPNPGQINPEQAQKAG